MHVTRLDSADCARATELCELTGGKFEMQVELERPHAKLWVARPAVGADPVALLLVWVVADERHVLHLGTHPRWRRRGAARALLSTLLACARASRARLVLLEVRRSNHAAIALYRSAGFSAVALRQSYYGDNDEDAIEMMLELDPETGNPVPTGDQVEP
jgi:ribosomal-protein-alanine N-acetyltransferase